MSPVERAIIFATDAHAGAKRKGKTRPYILHPIEAMTIVGGMTDDEDLLAAAVLHDTMEDAGITKEDLLREFGGRVAALVSAESEDKMRSASPDKTWTARKQKTISDLQSASREEKLICLGDKLSNLREIAADYREIGDALWGRFNQKDKSMHGWYYRSVFDALAAEFGSVPPILEYGNLLAQVFGMEGKT